MAYSARFSKAVLTHSNTAVQRGIDNTLPAVLEPNLQELSNFLAFLERELSTEHPGLTLSISSGYRCPELNAAVGGSPNSDHKQGRAADVVANDLSPFALAVAISSVVNNYEQIIIEFGRWVHVAVAAPGQRGRCQKLTAKKQDGKTVYLAGFVR